MAREITHAILWTEPALCDMERIDRYLRRRNPAASRKMGEAILRRIELLATHPEIGPVWEEESRWRFLVVAPYRVFYRILAESHTVEICHVRHASRSGPSLDDLLTD